MFKAIIRWLFPTPQLQAYEDSGFCEVYSPPASWITINHEINYTASIIPEFLRVKLIEDVNCSPHTNSFCIAITENLRCGFFISPKRD